MTLDLTLTIDTFDLPLADHVVGGQDLVHYEVGSDVSVRSRRWFPGDEDFSFSHLSLEFTWLRGDCNTNIQMQIAK